MCTRLKCVLQRRMAGFCADQSGATAIEYALMASIISLLLVGGAVALAGSVRQMFTVLAGMAI